MTDVLRSTWRDDGTSPPSFKSSDSKEARSQLLVHHSSGPLSPQHGLLNAIPQLKTAILRLLPKLRKKAQRTTRCKSLWSSAATTKLYLIRTLVTHKTRRKKAMILAHLRRIRRMLPILRRPKSLRGRPDPGLRILISRQASSTSRPGSRKLMMLSSWAAAIPVTRIVARSPRQ